MADYPAMFDLRLKKRTKDITEGAVQGERSNISSKETKTLMDGIPGPGVLKSLEARLDPSTRPLHTFYPSLR